MVVAATLPSDEANSAPAEQATLLAAVAKWANFVVFAMST
jgi:hypothetical protein